MDISIKNIISTWGAQTELSIVETICEPLEKIITKPVEKLVEMIPDGIKKNEPVLDEVLQESLNENEKLSSAILVKQQQENMLQMLVSSLPLEYLASTI